MPRRPTPKPKPDTLNLNVNLNVSGGLTVKVEQTPPPSPLAGVWLTAIGGGIKVKGRSPMAYTLPDEMMIEVQVAYVDVNGNPAQVDGETTWETSNETVVQIVPNPDDSTHAQIWAKELGQAQITSTADADLGEGIKHILATLDINVVGGEAVSATIQPSGEPQPIPKDAASRGAGRRS